MTNSLVKQSYSVPPPESTNRFFTDVEGLRGIAVVTVVLFHASVPFTTGGFIGVDLFFVISGFLITGQLIREYERKGKVSFRDFYARRARRIIPPAAVVIVVSCLAVWLVMPLLSVFRQAFDLMAAAVNMANWRFIVQNKDYLAGGSDDSVATHFWSLSVEEQFYFVWPLLVVLFAYISHRLGRSIRLGVGIGIALVSLVSLVAAIRLTVSDPTLAYMATHTRAWQFGVGALVAISGPILAGLITNLSVRIAMWIVGWAGLAAVLYSTVAYGHSTPYPGWAAILPTLGGGAMIAAGQIAGSTGPAVGALLSMGWLRWLGQVSYAWYLWHWPAVVLFKEYTGITDWRVLVLVMLGALLLAWISTNWFEKPILASRELKKNLSASLCVGLTGLVVAAAATMSLGVLSVKKASATVTTSAAVDFNAVFGTSSGANSGPVSPNPFQAYEDRPERDECLVEQGDDRTPDSCFYGPENGIPAVLFGDSHAQHWLPMVKTVAEESNWKLYQFTKAACPAPALQPRDGRTDHFATPKCADWRADALSRIKDIRPKYIVVTSLSTYVPDYQEYKVAWDTTLAQLRTTGAKLLYIRDTPYPNFHVAECVSGALDDWSKCDFNLDNVNRFEPIITDQLKGENTDITVFDFNPFLCDANLCRSVRNGILLYRDNSHFTVTAVKLFVEPWKQMLQNKGIDLSVP